MTRLNTATRLFIAAALAAMVMLGSYAVQASLQPPKIKFPDKDFNTLPLRFGGWQGKRSPAPEPELFSAIGADVVVDSAFSDERGHVVMLHTAVFGNPDAGVYHSPMNCYRASGWQEENDTRLTLEVEGRQSRPIRFTTWSRDGTRVRSVYWYQLGEYTLFDRLDLGALRWKLRGMDTWPALIKVLMSMPASNDAEADQALMLSLAQPVYGWITDGATASVVSAQPAAVDVPAPTAAAKGQ